MTDAWSEEENAVVVRAYFSMLQQELTDQFYVKSHVNQQVRGLLNNRNHHSVELKFGNVSAVLNDSRALYVKGYKPRPHYQRSLRDAVQRYLDEHPNMLELMRHRVTQQAVPQVDFIWHEIEPPRLRRGFEPSLLSPVAIHTDFARLEAANRELGSSGELMVLGRERTRLRLGGRPDLAERVEHVSETQGDGLGFDIASFEFDGSPRLVEVKTTRLGKEWPMVVTRNEVDVSRRLRDRYVLARIFNFAQRSVGLYEVAGSIDETCHLDPLTYRALPKAA